MALNPVISVAVPRIAIQGGIFTLEPRPTMCHESTYWRSRSNPLAGVSGIAPPTKSAYLPLNAISEIARTAMNELRTGRDLIPVKIEGPLTSSISAFFAASSLKSIDEVWRLSSFLVSEVARQVRRSASLVLSMVSASWVPLGGTKRATTRDDTSRVALRARLARIRSCGWRITSATAANSSRA